MYPLKLTPAFKDYIWGGTALRDVYGKKCDYDKIAESWELSCHKDGLSIIDSGEFSGETLLNYIEKNGKKVLGTACEKFENFPILIKLIDAKDNLSVQVHPNNEYALRVEGEYGKTEMWYIVDCEDDATLICGFKENITHEQFAKAVMDNTFLDFANVVPVKKGDTFFIESGTLHAIGKGILIAEIQQNSNTTYRVYDYGRVDANGNGRPLHIEKALEVTTLTPPKKQAEYPMEKFDGFTSQKLATCEYFDVSRINFDGKSIFNADETSFHSILVLNGEISVLHNETTLEIKAGETVFIPAGTLNYEIIGKAEALFTKII